MDHKYMIVAVIVLSGAVALGQTTRPQTRPARTVIVRPPEGQTLDLKLEELGNFDFDPEKGRTIPDDVRKLNGVHLRTRGYMIPLDSGDEISEFLLSPRPLGERDPGPPVQQGIDVHCPPGKGVAYFGDLMQVEGTLTVEVRKDDGFVISILEINATSVKPVKK